MPVLVQICIVVVTLAFVALVAMTVRALNQLGRDTARLTTSVQLATTQFDRLARETQDLLASVRPILPPAQRVVNRLQSLGERAADLSAAVLEEIEEPVLTAVALARGVRAGAGRMMDLLMKRVAPNPITNNGDPTHE